MQQQIRHRYSTTSMSTPGGGCGWRYSGGFSGIASARYGLNTQKAYATNDSPFADDATWLRDIGGLLRERSDIRGAEVRRICAETRVFAE
jgi:hypothetical protein